MSTTCAPLLIASLALAGCRIGGASEYQQPSLDVSWPLPPPDTGEAIEDTFVAPIEETSAPPDTTVADDGVETEIDATIGETSTPESSPPDDSGCTPATAPAVCDPVKNTGCPSLSRCTTSGTANTGRCVYLGAIGVGGFCTTSESIPGFLGTDTCSPKLACLSNKCVALCYCNADCESGSCCSVAMGSSGFKGCGACP